MESAQANDPALKSLDSRRSACLGASQRTELVGQAPLGRPLLDQAFHPNHLVTGLLVGLVFIGAAEGTQCSIQGQQNGVVVLHGTSIYNLLKKS
jgi:hypothetical protein